MLIPYWQINSEPSIPWLRIAFNNTLMSVYRCLGNRESESRSVAAATNHWKEYPLKDFLGNPRTVINNINSAYNPVTLTSNSEAPLNA